MSSDPKRRSRLANLTSKLPIPGAHSHNAAERERIRRSSNSASLLQPLASNSNPSSPTHGSHYHSQTQNPFGHNPNNASYSSSYSNNINRPSSPTYSEGMSSNVHGYAPETVNYRNDDDLVPPVAPFVPHDGGSLSSRRSSNSFLNDKDKDSSLLNNQRPSSLSLNYVPAKFTKLHSQGEYAHRKAKQGGGRDAFAANAQRMGMMGTVDDDEGVVFQVGKGGLKKKKPKLRWNRFKWILFISNIVLIAYGMTALVSAILVWLNVFYQSDVIRVGNRTELIISTVAGAFIVLTSLIGFAGILLNNRAFLAVFTLFLWFCLALMVTPGYMTYKQRTFNLEGKINSQWSRSLGTEGRLRIQDALRCCGYFSPYVEATVSPLCYSRSNLPGCKSRYLHLERRVLGIWVATSFGLVPAHVIIMVAALLCSNHITYRFGKGLTPKRYRLDLGSMAVIMDEYAGQIAAQYGPNVAAEALNRSSIHVPLRPESDYGSPAGSHRGSFTNLVTGSSTGLAPPQTNVTSRYSSASTGYNSAAAAMASGASTRGVSLYDPTNPRASSDQRRDSDTSLAGGGRYFDSDAATRGGGQSNTGSLYGPSGLGQSHGNDSAVSFSSDDHRQGRR
ncbi:tetraspanin Tsp2 [Kwoniella heveanensis CBS 569]|nr:tetraspanin Tsp2 [Kwoniella heveanensis CBS 569]